MTEKIRSEKYIQTIICWERTTFAEKDLPRNNSLGKTYFENFAGKDISQ